MKENKSYIIDVLNLVPDNSICFIQAPSIDESSTLNDVLTPSEFDCYHQVILSPTNKKTIIEIIKDEEIEADFQSIEIRHNGKLYFEGYDGMQFGTISKELEFPENFIKNYIDSDMCSIAAEW